MKGKLYTTCFRNIKNIPKDFQVFSVVRQPNNLPNIQCFSPSTSLLRQYKSKQISYYEFREKFLRELENNEIASETFNSIILRINSGVNIVFVCYENKPDYCHRQILGELFKEVGIDYCGEV